MAMPLQMILVMFVIPCIFIVTLGTIRPEDSGAAQNATEFHH